MIYRYTLRFEKIMKDTWRCVTNPENAPTFVKFDKCEFDWKEIAFLGYTISKEGIVIDSAIMEVV